MNRFVFALLISCVSLTANALPLQNLAPLVAKPGKMTSPIRDGAIIGGQADREFSLIAINAKTAGTGERVTIAYGDAAGKPWKGEPGFFHAVLDRESKRLVIDLAQVNKTRVDVAVLQKIFSHSRFVASTDITMDPHDGSTNITLLMKEPVTVVAATDPRHNGQAIFELRGNGEAKK
jgi:hypothetical protein